MAERYQAWRERNAERGDRRNGGGMLYPVNSMKTGAISDGYLKVIRAPSFGARKSD